jgi:hypothetical protein
MSEQVLINAIRTVAQNRSEAGSVWNNVNEYMLDGDILEFLSEADFDLPKALQAIENYWNEPDYYSGHKREYNPDNYRGI